MTIGPAVVGGRTPEFSAEAGGAIRRLCTQDSNYISAQVLTVDGGSP
ncbi:hypothetical protein ACIA8E_12965 [Streptomyces sp. NPDC051664]